MNILPTINPQLSPKWETFSLQNRPDDVFTTAVKLLTKYFPDLILKSDSSKTIKSLVRHNGKALIDYDREALFFNQAYFLRNLYKCLCFLASPDVTIPGNSIVDIGCGAGPFSLAAHLTYYRDCFQQTMLVDNSAAQLSLAHNIFNTFHVPVTHWNSAGLFEFSPPTNFHRLASYWLCESLTNAGLSSAEKQILIEPGLLLIDYPDVLENFAATLDTTLYTYRFLFNSFKLTTDVARTLEKDNVSVHGLTVRPTNTN